ncbi:hypothetical protein Lal_00043523 [Lupinus albus]|nr:hypothetical protein Lal_00043523 [Lupinus albus]
MASSSKMRQSPTMASSTKSNPLNLTKLLANDAQRKVFQENFHGRAIFTPKYGDITRFGLVCEWDDYDRKKFYLSICRIYKEEIERRKQQSLGETVKNKDILSAGYLTLEDRLIHYFLSYVILPKFSNHSQISDIELQLISCTRRTYKHRTDRQPAPTDEPEPTTAPNQPESHAQSSASTAMPTNLMIMDELVSLRGYITKRMDAFDTQSQQIHYELHRLSSRLSNMDVDDYGCVFSMWV